MARESIQRARGFVAAELRRHPWMVPGVALTGSAAFGSALPDILAAVRSVF